MSYVRTKSTKNAISSVIDRIKTLDIASLHHFRLTIYYMFVPAIVFMVFLATSTNTYADPVTLRATIEPVLQVNLDSDLVSLDLSPINSTTAFDNEDLNVTVVTNNQAGYNLSLTASSTDLTRTTALADNTTPTIPTLTTAASADNFPANRWGYRTDSTANYSPFATTINFPSVTTPTDGTNTTINFAAKINDAQPAGTYELDLVFAATARPTTQDFIINFDSGVSSVAVKTGSTTGTTVGSVATTGGTVAGLANGATYYLVPTFAEGYEFSSWTNDSGSVGTLGTADANGIVTYTVGDQVDAGDINSVTLATEKVKPAMQNLADDMCVTSEPTLVKDTRDGKTYTVQRLADGKCWMTSDLNLAGGTALYSDDSNVPTTGYTKASGNAYYTLPASQTITSGTSLPSSAFSDNSTAYVFNTDNETTSQSDCTSSKPCNSYYSWLAATAGGKDASGSAVTGNGYDTAYSICPKGWRLPTSGNNNDSSATSTTGYKKGDFYKLAIQYGMSSNNYYQNTSSFYGQAGPGTTPNFLLAGYYDSGSFSFGGSNGLYWSATSSSSTGGYYLYFYSGYVGSAYDRTRRNGFSVRCVKQTDAERELGISTMQDFGNLSSTDKTNLINSMELEKAYTLTDSRDSQSYTISKLKDGKVWMTQNLKLGKSTASKSLTTADSDVQSSGFTLKGKLSNGKFTYTTVSGTDFQNNSSQYYCTDNYGCYYNWYTATAGSGTASVSSGNVNYSICPKGWTLPTGGSSGDFQTLYSHYNSATAMLVSPTSAKENTNGASAPGFLLGGNYNTSGVYIGTYGYYWSRSADSAQRGYNLDLNTSSVSANSHFKYYGMAVRCVLK